MSLREKTLIGLTWTFSQQFIVQIINIVVQIILARLLTPEIFGLVAMVYIFVAIGQNLMDGGMTSSIIRTNEPDDKDYSTVFITNISISILFYIIIFLLSPSIAKFYNQPILDLIIKIFGLNFIIRSLSAVHLAKMNKEMDFKQIAKFQIPSYLIGGISAILLAIFDYGIWSLVFMHLIQSLVFTAQNWIFIKWKPSILFCSKKFKNHFSFGYKITISSLLSAIFANSYNVLIGKLFTPMQAGFFNHANIYRLFPAGQITSVVDKVAYPMFAEIKDELTIKANYRKILRFIFSLILPTMLLSIILAEELFFLVFGTKWLAAVPIFQVLAIASIFKPLTLFSLNILKVKDKPNYILKFQIISNIIGLILLLLSYSFGIIYIAYSVVISSLFTALLHMWISGIEIKYSLYLQIKDLGKIFISGLLTIGISLFFKVLFINLLNTGFLFIFIFSLFFFTINICTIRIIEKELYLNYTYLLKKS